MGTIEKGITRNSMFEFQTSFVRGTFDILHSGHKLLLSSAALLTKSILYIELLDYNNTFHPYDFRKEELLKFLLMLAPKLKVIISPQPL